GDTLEIVFQHAGWLLLTGDRDAYRRLCSQSVERFGQAPDPLRAAYLLARMCSLDVEPGVSLERLTPLAQRAVNAASHHQHTLGLVEYRAGRYDEAISYFKQSMDGDPSWPGTTTPSLGLALAHHHTRRA